MWPEAVKLTELARDLGIAESTARRWAGALSDLMPSTGKGAARRFHPQAGQVLARAKALFEEGFTTEQVSEALHQEFAATVEVAPVTEDVESGSQAIASALKLLADRQAWVIDEVQQLRGELAGVRKQMDQLCLKENEESQVVQDELAFLKENVGIAVEKTLTILQRQEKLEQELIAAKAAQEEERRLVEEQHRQALEERDQFLLSNLKQALEEKRLPWWKKMLKRSSSGE